ncbi:MAG: nuclear transport factor 2 family protein [Anaerostipes hadrus]|nr:nuclear transport factor 2 family protein [Anaerostipes hadrus]
MEIMEVMNQYYDAYNGGGYDKAPFSDDLVFESLFGKVEGRENVIKHLIEAHGGDIVQEKLVPTNILINNNRVGVELDGELSFKEDVPDFPFGTAKKGESIVVKFAAFYEIADDKIKKVTVYRL